MISISKNTVSATNQRFLREEKTEEMPLDKWLESVNERTYPNTGNLVLPDGFKLLWPRGDSFFGVYEIKPRIHYIKWSKYNNKEGSHLDSSFYKIALPYVWFFIVYYNNKWDYFESRLRGVFFGREPFSLDAEVYKPCFANCNTFMEFSEEEPEPEEEPFNVYQDLCCTVENKKGDLNYIIRSSISPIVTAVLGSGFNSDMEKVTDFYNCINNERCPFCSVKEWEKKSLDNPEFALDDIWVPVLSARKLLKISISRYIHSVKPLTIGNLAHPVFSWKSD